MWNNQKQQKMFSLMSNLQTYYHFKLDFQKVLIFQSIGCQHDELSIFIYILYFLFLKQMQHGILYWYFKALVVRKMSFVLPLMFSLDIYHVHLLGNKATTPTT